MTALPGLIHQTNTRWNGLPLVEVEPLAPVRPELVVLLTGDGGWAGFDRRLGLEFAARGLAVVGLNSLRYFWRRRPPQTAARDLSRILNHYGASWHKVGTVLAGFSLGASVLPFMIAHLPAELRASIRLVALLAPVPAIDFQFHLSNWIGVGPRGQRRPVLPEMAGLNGLKTVCFYGLKEKKSLCHAPLPSSVIKIPLPGGHHLGGDTAAVVEIILQALPRPEPSGYSFY